MSDFMSSFAFKLMKKKKSNKYLLSTLMHINILRKFGLPNMKKKAVLLIMGMIRTIIKTTMMIIFSSEH